MGISYNTSTVRDGLVLHLDAANTKSYPGTGTTWNDLSGNGNNGTLINGPTYSSDNKGSIVFDGVNDTSSFPLTCSNIYYSINWWTYPTSLLNFNQAFGIDPAGWGTFVFHTTADGSVYVGTDVSSRMTNLNLGAGTISLNMWNNFTFTFNNRTAKFYKNGNLLYTTPNMNISANTFTGMTLSTIQGNFSAMSVYDKALTALEVQQNFEALRGRYGI